MNDSDGTGRFEQEDPFEHGKVTPRTVALWFGLGVMMWVIGIVYATVCIGLRNP
ncbi:hypothetical protein [Streptomyces sp. NPDC026673]|uniref:hypothetical protein n=1 Tax=Streptomyces sp. NPDC026673 TaxID=3155724 RepID=UPI0033FCEBDC